jgi:hypothetical protein
MLVFSRAVILPVWLVVFGLLALFWSPMTAAAGVGLLIVGIMGPSIMLMLWKETLSHSWRSAAAGSPRAARRAGM